MYIRCIYNNVLGTLHKYIHCMYVGNGSHIIAVHVHVAVQTTDVIEDIVSWDIGS